MAIPIKAVLSVSTAGFKTGMTVATKALGGFVAIAKTASLVLVGLAAGFAALVLRQAAVIDRIGKVAKVTGVAAETLQKFGFAAELAGVSSDQAAVALRRFSRRLGEAQKGTGELAPTLKRLGIELRGSNGEFKNAEEVLFDLADGIRDTEGASARLSIAFKAFDSEGAELVSTLVKGGAALEEVFKEAEALGLVLSTKTIQGVENFNDEMLKLRSSISGVVNQFIGALAPALTEVTEDFVDFLKSFSKEGKGFEDFGQYLKFQFFDILINITKAFAGLYNIIVKMVNVIGTAGKEMGLFRTEADDVAEVLNALNDLDSGGGMMFNLGPLKAGLLEFEVLSGRAKEIFDELFAGKTFISNSERLAAIDELTQRLEALGGNGGIALLDVENIVTYLRELQTFEPMVITITKGVEDQRTAWQKIVDLLRDGVANMVAFQEATMDWGKIFEDVAARLGTPMERLSNTLTDGLVKGVELFEDTLANAIVTGKADFSTLGDHIKQVLAKAMVQKFISGPILSLFGLASGGPAKAGQPYIVGEEGPELFIPKNSGTVIPNDITEGLAGGQGIGMGGGQVTYNINAVDARSFKQLVASDPEYLYNVTQVGARRQPR